MKKVKKEKDITVSIIRVLSMLMIILDHLLPWKGIDNEHLLSVGVEIFLFISGYLYGDRVLDSFSKFMGGRVVKLLPSLWIMALVVGIPTLYYDKQSKILTFIVYALNLQGLPFVFGSIKKWPVIPGIGQLWFITVIFICYIIMFFLKKYDVDKWIERNLYLSSIIAIASIVICGLLKIRLTYIIIYFVGYYWKKCSDRLSIGRIRFYILSIVTTAVCLLRIILRNTIDGTVMYDYIISRVSMVLLAIWIITCVALIIENNVQISSKVANSKIWVKLDQLSYPLFVVHYPFLVGIYDVSKLFGKGVVGISIYILATVICAIILNMICDKINYFYKKYN